MQKVILTIIASASVLASAFSQSLTINQTATPTLNPTGVTFTFSMFDSNLGNLTAVQLLFNTAVATGSVLITAAALDEGTFTSMTSRLQTSGTGLSTQSTGNTTISFNPSLPATVPAGTNQTFSVVGSQSLISSVQTYSINSGSFSSYQNAGGTGFTPNFTGRVTANFLVSGDTAPGTNSGLYGALANYTLRYTYTPDIAPIPEPGQVAASLLLLSGIGAYVFIKRRKKSAPASA